MRILYFSRSYTSHDRRFLSELASSPHETSYLRLQDDRICYESRAVPDGIRVLPSLGYADSVTQIQELFQHLPSLESVLSDVNPDIVHAGPIHNCAFLTALTGFRPFLAMSWASDLLVEARSNELSAWIARYTLRHADLLATDSAEVSREAQAIAQLPAERIVQFPWGVDLSRFRPGTADPRIRPAEWEDAVVAIATRSWEPGYGVLELLQAFQHASQNQARLRLLLLGDGSLRPQVEAFIRECALEPTVALRGAIPHEALPEFFRAADLYISCAYSDGSSLSLLEAMATGLPAIVTDRASNREWISDGRGGRLAPFGRTLAISAALQEIAALPAECRKAMGKHNRMMAETHGNWQKNFRKLLDAYERLRTANGVPS